MKEILLVIAAAISCALGTPLHTNWSVLNSATLENPVQDQSTEVNSAIQKLSATDPFERVKAACSLGEIRAQAAIPALVKLLADNTLVQFSGCSGKADWKDKSIPKTTPGEMAAVALSRMGAPAVEPLIGAIKSDAEVTTSPCGWTL